MNRERSRDRKSQSYRSKKKSHNSKSRHRSSDEDSDDSRRKSRSKKKCHKDKSKKKSHKHDKKSDSSESSDSSEEDSLDLYKRLEAKREEIMLQKKREKELMKANETPEEKRLRRLLKKEAKERKRKQRMGWDKDYLHYTNSDNPFGDANILSTFVWNKKLSKEGLTNVTREELERRNREKQMENKAELEKVKQRRLEREREREEREEAMQALQREREAEQFEVWERQEDQFHLDQARLRSKIRIADGRAKPIDLLAKYINSEEEVDTVEMHEPYTYLNGLTIKDLEDLIEDIKVYIKLEHGRNLDYWNDITVIVEDELHKLRKLQKKTDYEVAVGRREGIHESVANEVSTVFKGKTASQLEALRKQIEKKIDDKAEGTDIGYWESLLSQLKAHIARARLRDRHQENLKKKLEVLKAEQGVEQEAQSSSSADRVDTRVSDSIKQYRDAAAAAKHGNDSESQSSDDEDSESRVEDAATAMVNESLIEYGRGCYSPVLLRIDDLEPGTLIIPEEEDEQRLQYARMRLLHPQRMPPDGEADRVMQKEARKGMTDDEAVFSVEAPLESQNYLWSDKYRPRKPRYFNRVHTGFEWNKYNQTHYDMDNPPPKIVQGYKFNIFYPDLIDKNSTPQYFLTACADNTDFCILRFHAGPPYEDIAFKIVNREWEYSYKRGFRCQFHNNIFQLWFHFKRYRYRR